MLQFASPERGDSLAAVIAVMGAPLGSDLNPARLDGFISVPSTVPGDDVVQATLAGSASRDEARPAAVGDRHPRRTRARAWRCSATTDDQD